MDRFSSMMRRGQRVKKVSTCSGNAAASADLFFFFYVQAGIMRPVFWVGGGKRGRAQDTIALEDLRGIDTKQTR